MEDIQKMISGRDSISGHVVDYTLIGEAEEHEDSELYYAKLSLDTGAIVFLKSTQEYLEDLLAQRDRAATFIGDFVNEETQQLGAESIVFWDDAYLV
ncbi:MAG: hypothetical protein RL326_2221 [Pseudomonadota bacterium]|jgi:hypothetical protein